MIDWESERFEAAVSELGLDEAVGCILRCADRRLTIEMPIHMAKGGVPCDPATMSTRELREISRSYLAEWAGVSRMGGFPGGR